jgi:hypothetical protein
VPYVITGMKKIFLLIVAVSFFIHAQAQKDFSDSISQSRNMLTKNAMIVLGGWSIVNIASGFIIAGNTTGEAKYFWRMNAYWNFINLGLAGLGYAGVRKAMKIHYGFTENFKAQHAIEKLYIFNAGLDLAYIAGGFYLRERGKNENDLKKQDQFRGYGSSIAVQGGFLLLMDCVMYALHHKNTSRMNNKLQRWEITTAPGGLGINYTF